MTEKLDTLVDKRLARLKEAQQIFHRNNQISIPKIQRVPHFLRQNDRFAKYCSPKIISFGPIHHDTESLKQGEHYKLLWTSIFVEEYGRKTHQEANRASQILLQNIENNIEELKNLFTEDAIGSYTDSDLAWMLFVDGCSLLHFMENVDDQCPEALHLKLDQLMYIWRDILLLENQLPTKVLEILCKEMEPNMEYLLRNYYNMGKCKRLDMTVISLESPKPFHILDCVRLIFVSSNRSLNIDRDNHIATQSEGNEYNQMGIRTILNQQDGDEHKFRSYTYKSIRDLKTAGIRVMPNTSKTDKTRWSNISFCSKWFSGELRLPVFTFNDATPYFFRNLIAFEMCPDVHYNYECCSFFTFIDSLVDNAEDVKELRLAGIFQNLLGSDEDLAMLFNELGDDIPTKTHSSNLHTNAVAYSKKYILVKLQIEMHYRNKWKTMLAQAYNTHFNTPWAIIAFFAASLALVLTFIQTWFSIYPN